MAGSITAVTAQGVVLFQPLAQRLYHDLTGSRPALHGGNFQGAYSSALPRSTVMRWRLFALTVTISYLMRTLFLVSTPRPCVLATPSWEGGQASRWHRPA